MSESRSQLIATPFDASSTALQTPFVARVSPEKSGT
jgi:hypothetical protein